jgi:hypothetical protein
LFWVHHFHTLIVWLIFHFSSSSCKSIDACAHFQYFYIYIYIRALPCWFLHMFGLNWLLIFIFLFLFHMNAHFMFKKFQTHQWIQCSFTVGQICFLIVLSHNHFQSSSDFQGSIQHVSIASDALFVFETIVWKIWRLMKWFDGMLTKFVKDRLPLSFGKQYAFNLRFTNERDLDRWLKQRVLSSKTHENVNVIDMPNVWWSYRNVTWSKISKNIVRRPRHKLIVSHIRKNHKCCFRKSSSRVHATPCHPVITIE